MFVTTISFLSFRLQINIRAIPVELGLKNRANLLHIAPLLMSRSNNQNHFITRMHMYIYIYIQYIHTYPQIYTLECHTMGPVPRKVQIINADFEMHATSSVLFQQSFLFFTIGPESGPSHLVVKSLTHGS